jgi:glutathione reductase (NADPH)
MGRRFDVAVLGSGGAATAAAIECRKEGRSVAVIDSGLLERKPADGWRPRTVAAEILDWARRNRFSGVVTKPPQINMRALLQFDRSLLEPPAARIHELKERGIVPYAVPGRFVSTEEVDAGGERLEAVEFVIATGATPAALNIPGKNLLTTCEDYLETEKAPKTVVFLGSDELAFQLAHLAVRAGSSATILAERSTVLDRFDPDIVELLLAHTRRLGIHILLNASLQTLEPGLVVTAAQHRLHTAMVVDARGLEPRLSGLNLDAAGVRAGAQGIAVNDYLQSLSNEHVYAAGAVADCDAPRNSPAAVVQGRTAARNLLCGNIERYSGTDGVRTVATIPPLAMVGLTEAVARICELDFDVLWGNSIRSYQSRMLAEECSGYKFLVEKRTGRIVGAHLLGEGAPQACNLFAMAIHLGLTVKQVTALSYAPGTLGSELVRELGGKY